MEEIEEKCRGCRIYTGPKKESIYYPCYFKVRDKEEMCPCTECLVKVICKESCHLRREKYVEMMRGVNIVNEYIV